MKSLIVKHGFNCSGIWRLKDKLLISVSYEELNLPEKLRQKFQNWIKWYWDTFYNDVEFSFESFIFNGESLTRELRRFLGDSYSVTYKSKFGLEEIKNEYERLKCVNMV